MSDYTDFWFIDTRNQVKNVKRWFIWGVLLFIFVTVCTIICVRSMYQPIKNYEIQADVPVVNVEEAKKTNANGYIKGIVINNSEEDLKGKYIKFTFYTKNNVDVGNEYVEIGDLKPQESKTYEAKFRYANVERFVITISDKKE